MVLIVSVDVTGAAEVISTELLLKVHVGRLLPPPGPTTAQARLTVPVKLFAGVAVMVEVMEPPAVTLAGLAPLFISVKVGLVELLALTTACRPRV